jgi:hypothetical protein
MRARTNPRVECDGESIHPRNRPDMEEIIFVVEEEAEGGFSAHALGVPIFTEADDLDGLASQVRDAVLCHFADDADRPRVIRLHHVRDQLIPL